MFYDLNIPYPATLERDDRERLERILSRISTCAVQKATIALNRVITASLKNAEPWNPIKPEIFKDIQQLRRVTMVVEDTKANYQLTASNPLNAEIDILAVQPTNIDICKHACQTYDIDLISIDLSKKKMLPSHVATQVAISRGIFFEICYTQAYRDVDKRPVFYSNAKKLVELTRGKNIVFSSEALRALEIRSRSDLKIMGLLLGMTEAQVEASCGYNYARLLKKAETRKSTLNAAIRFDPIEEPTGQGVKRKGNETPKEVPSKKAKKGKTE
ncbi:RNase P subunit p30-domain-containing protein [Spinellus fusiger]|nr:RNase P subunit p30-domain-containing protein [Spinellus fusiger]